MVLSMISGLREDGEKSYVLKGVMMCRGTVQETLGRYWRDENIILERKPEINSYFRTCKHIQMGRLRWEM